ncbi:MAG: GTP 3',8-cyclase MoaA [Candidatus Omnitrophica bacterium]|nr:GTP 3',8-cyclase MoaA [Candidatus Omnitrophota bacterium]
MNRSKQSSLPINDQFDPTRISLRLSVTEKCQLRCCYCMPEPVRHDDNSLPPLSKEEIRQVIGSLQSYYRISKLQLTGGDPLVRADLGEIIKSLSCEQIPDISLTTNGQALKQWAKRLQESGLNRMNISLDSIDRDRFRRITKTGDLHKTIEGIEAAIEQKMQPVKLNTVVMRGVNEEEIADIADFGLSRGCQVRFLELMPIGAASRRFETLYVSSSEVKTRLSREFHFSPLPDSPASSSVNYTVVSKTGLTGVIGFISPYSAPFCSRCNRLRLTSSGRFVGCLKLGNSIDIRSILESESPSTDRLIVEAAKKVLSQKQNAAVSSNTSSFQSKEIMAAIGG